MRDAMKWFSAKCVYQHKGQKTGRRQMYEERMILIRAESFESARIKVEKESKEYLAEFESIKLVEILEIYELDCDKKIGDLQELFSSMYSSNLKPNGFLRKFFPNPHLVDCSKHKLNHRWYRKNDTTRACYHCSQIQINRKQK
jgi:hypothetical protein